MAGNLGKIVWIWGAIHVCWVDFLMFLGKVILQLQSLECFFFFNLVHVIQNCFCFAFPSSDFFENHTSHTDRANLLQNESQLKLCQAHLPVFGTS